jgi:amino acid/peptide:H+ symporter
LRLDREEAPMALGHPKGLFPLFFTEMWERLAFYTMVGILLLYTTDTERGGLGLPASQGNEIYGLYLAFVYFTPFLGGMLADRFLGYRRAVALGGLLMGGGLLLMGLPGFTFFVLGLIGLILGNGFFKPNISVMVGNLYAPGDPKRDSGFNIFYMGINIGALLATLVVAPLFRNEFGWLWTFRAAGIGVLIAVVILITQWRLLAAADRQPERGAGAKDSALGKIFLVIVLFFAFGAIGYMVAEWVGMQLVRPSDFGFLIGSIPVILFFVWLGLSADKKERAGLLALLPIYVAGGAFFMILHLNGSAMTQWARDETDRRAEGPAQLLTMALPFIEQEALPSYYVNAAPEVPRPDPDSLLVVESKKLARMYGQQRMDQAAVERIDSFEGIDAVTIEQDSPDTWKARATDVYEAGVVEVEETTGAHGERTVSVSVPDGAQAERRVVFLTEVADERMPLFVVHEELFQRLYDDYRARYGQEPELLAPGRYLSVINPEVYQSWNPFFVIVLTPFVVGFFAWRVRKNKPVPTAHKLLYGTIFTTIALLFMALAGLFTQGGTIKVSGLWLMSFYMIITIGELCLSPMGLSLVTKLTPARLVGLTMGGWFLATAIGNKFSGFFGGVQALMDPMYFFLLLAGLSAVVALFILAVLPKLDKAIKSYGA